MGIEHDVGKLWPHFKKDVGKVGRVQRATRMLVLLTSHKFIQNKVKIIDNKLLTALLFIRKKALVSLKFLKLKLDTFMRNELTFFFSTFEMRK